MKTISLVCSLLAFVSYSQKIHFTSDHKIKGKILVQRKLFYDEKQYEFEIDKNKPFIKNVPVSECVSVFVVFGADNIFGFLGPKTNLNVHFSKNNLVFGKQDFVNTFSNDFHTMFFKKVKNDRESLIKNIDAIAQKAFEKLEKIKNKISKKAYKTLKAALKGRFFFFKYLKHKNDKNHDEYLNKISQEIFNNGKFLKSFLNYGDNYGVAREIFITILEKNGLSDAFYKGNILKKIEILNTYSKNKTFTSAMLLRFASEEIALGNEKNKAKILKKLQKSLDKKAYVFLKLLKANSSKKAKVGDAFKLFDCLKPLGKNKILKGKYLYVDNWATWCMPCTGAIKFFIKNKIKIPKNVQMVFVSFDRNKKTALHFIEKFTFPKGTVHFFNKGSVRSEYAKNYNINGLPVCFLIDKQGKIKDLNPPKMDSKEFEKYLQNLK